MAKAKQAKEIPDLNWFEKRNFDGGRMKKGSITSASHCSFRKAEFPKRMQFYKCSDCVFDGARMPFLWLSRADREYFYERTSFQNADLSGTFGRESLFKNCDFSGADLSRSQLDKAQFVSAKMRGTNLKNAYLFGAKLVKADLTDADLTGANLQGADLSGARVAGANFLGANLSKVNFTGVDLSKAKNVEHRQPRKEVGPKMKELAKLACSTKGLTVQANVDVRGAIVEISMHGKFDSDGKPYAADYPQGGVCGSGGVPVPAPTFEKGMLNLANRWGHGKLKVDTVRVQPGDCKLSNDALLELAIAAWCEAFGMVDSSGDVIAKHHQRQAKNEQKNQERHERMLADIRGGPAGIKRWNAVKPEDRKNVGSFRDLDLSGLDLTGAKFSGLDMEGCKFDGSVLTGAEFSCALKGTSFQKANLSKATLRTDCSEISFAGANLTEALLRSATCRGTSFRGADLRQANLAEADLRGADFTAANLDGADLNGVKHDHHTRWPKGFEFPANTRWYGEGANPLEFAGFLKEIAASTSTGRLAAARRLLQAGRCQILGDLSIDALIGVVKGPDGEGLFHVCRLAEDGSFACCTEKLAGCPDTRTGPCAHLLVLIIGLAKAGEVEMDDMVAWLMASRKQHQVLDQNLMGDMLDRFTAAALGKSDRQPTETIPEDHS